VRFGRESPCGAVSNSLHLMPSPCPFLLIQNVSGKLGVLECRITLSHAIGVFNCKKEGTSYGAATKESVTA
jgi:hypothetical protein